MSRMRAGRTFLVAAGLALGGCAVTPGPAPDAAQGALPPAEARVLERFRARSPRVEQFLQEACGYAVFPTVARFVLGFGGGSGTGLLVEGSTVVGSVRAVEFIHGISFGGMVYSQLIIFRDAEAIAAFKKGELEFRGRAATAVGPLGGSADPAFSQGVAVFTLTRAGLMLDMSVSGARFQFSPRDEPVTPVACRAVAGHG